MLLTMRTYLRRSVPLAGLFLAAALFPQALLAQSMNNLLCDDSEGIYSGVYTDTAGRDHNVVIECGQSDCSVHDRGQDANGEHHYDTQTNTTQHTVGDDNPKEQHDDWDMHWEHNYLMFQHVMDECGAPVQKIP